MNATDDINAAAERLSTSTYPPKTEVQTILTDAIVVADAYLALLDQQAAADAERAKAIDSEWLVSIGFTEQQEHDSISRWTVWEISTAWHRVIVEGNAVNLENISYSKTIRIGMTDSTTRGMMIDFLAGLLIPVKGFEVPQ